MKRRFLLSCAAAIGLAALLVADSELRNHPPQALEAPGQDGSVASAVTPPKETRPQATPETVTVDVGKSTVVESAVPVERVSIGLGDAVVATAISPYEVLLNGKSPGATTMILWQEGGARLVYDIVVRPNQFLADDRLEGVGRQIKQELPTAEIRLSEEGGSVLVRGKVDDLTSADRALAIASTLGKIVNLLYVDVPAAEPQILLKVKFASVDRSLSNQLGLNLFSTGATNSIGSVGTQEFSPPLFTGSVNGPSGGVTLSDALNLFLFRPDLNLGATIRALETKGLLEVLSEPNVLAQNGQQASFLAGGEFPFPVVQGSTGGTAAAVTIQFREFGVRLNFLPSITPRGSIMLRVAPEVSALDFTHGLTVNGFAVPALTVRKLNTAVELNRGQSFAIGGLLDNRVTDTFEKIPFLGDVPVIGKFFQSRSRNKENTELIVIVTPEIVQPIAKGQPVPALNEPVPFLPKNTGGDVIGKTAAAPVNIPPPTIPVEKLIKALQVESANPTPAQPALQPPAFGPSAPSAGPAKP